MPASDSQFELSEAVGLDQADSAVATDLERARGYLASKQWSEAVGTIRRVMELSGDRLWPVTPRRFIPVREYCQLLLVSLPPPALAVYRSQVDSSARRWYDRGVAERDAAMLGKVVSDTFASSWGDDALLALGELALDSGDAAMARIWWERILPAASRPDEAQTWLAFPDTNLDPAAVRARLVLASILEGSRGRAADELAQFERLHPKAQGRLGGVEVDYAEALRRLLAESVHWPARRPGGDWPTFAGSAERNHVAPSGVDPAGVAWRFALGDPTASNAPPAAGVMACVSDDGATAGPWFHPTHVGSWIFVNDARRVWVLDLATGKPAWGDSAVVFEGASDVSPGQPGLPGAAIGRPRFTNTIAGGKLFARLGDPCTAQPRHLPAADEESYLVAIDVAGEGRLIWKVFPPAGGWAFEGSPLRDGRNVYVALRRTDIRAEAHVACYDAETGRPRWRRFVCAAQTPSQNLYPEITHNLLTLAGGTLYYNSNLGAVGALSAETGHVRWISLYPRRRQGDLARPAPHWSRTLAPCVYYQGTLLVAPSDSRRIFGLDAATGQILWQTGSQVEDVAHLLGAADGQLIASGRRLYWIDVTGENQGRIRHVWPPAETFRPQGRGVLADRWIYLPADDRVYVFDRSSAELNRIIELQPHGVAGGNLLVADGRLLVATARELVALGPPTAERPNDDGKTPDVAVSRARMTRE